MDEEREPLAGGDEAPKGATGAGEDLCRECGGTGEVDGAKCEACGGTGRVSTAIGGG